jgi:hypothetical protein
MQNGWDLWCSSQSSTSQQAVTLVLLALSLFLSANPKTGGALADLTFNIIGTGGDITNSMTTLEFVFPLEYSLGAQGLTCIRISGFSQDPICSISATNTLRIDLTYLNTSPFSIIALIIQKIQNPIVESGPFNYNLRLVISIY